MADEKQLNAVRFFCKHPSSNSGSKKSKADYPNWGDLVQQISYFDFGHIQKDMAIVSNRGSNHSKGISQRQGLDPDCQWSRR